MAPRAAAHSSSARDAAATVLGRGRHVVDAGPAVLDDDGSHADGMAVHAGGGVAGLRAYAPVDTAAGLDLAGPQALRRGVGGQPCVAGAGDVRLDALRHGNRWKGKRTVCTRVVASAV